MGVPPAAGPEAGEIEKMIRCENSDVLPAGIGGRGGDPRPARRHGKGDVEARVARTVGRDLRRCRRRSRPRESPAESPDRPGSRRTRDRASSTPPRGSSRRSACPRRPECSTSDDRESSAGRSSRRPRLRRRSVSTPLPLQVDREVDTELSRIEFCVIARRVRSDAPGWWRECRRIPWVSTLSGREAGTGIHDHSVIHRVERVPMTIAFPPFCVWKIPKRWIPIRCRRSRGRDFGDANGSQGTEARAAEVDPVEGPLELVALDGHVRPGLNMRMPRRA